MTAERFRVIGSCSDHVPELEAQPVTPPRLLELLIDVGLRDGLGDDVEMMQQIGGELEQQLVMQLRVVPGGLEQSYPESARADSEGAQHSRQRNTLVDPAACGAWRRGTGWALRDWLRARGHEPRMTDLPG